MPFSSFAPTSANDAEVFLAARDRIVTHKGDFVAESTVVVLVSWKSGQSEPPSFFSKVIFTPSGWLPVIPAPNTTPPPPR